MRSSIGAMREIRLVLHMHTDLQAPPFIHKTIIFFPCFDRFDALKVAKKISKYLTIQSSHFSISLDSQTAATYNIGWVARYSWSG